MTLRRYGIHQGLDGEDEVYESVNGDYFKADEVRAALMQTIKQLRQQADDCYVESLRISEAQCRGLQVLEKFSPDDQQKKVKWLREAEQLMGKHIAYATAAKLLGEVSP